VYGVPGEEYLADIGAERQSAFYVVTKAVFDLCNAEPTSTSPGSQIAAESPS
jgi:hypothetical protein